MKSPARRHGADAALSPFPRVGKGKTPGKGIFATRERDFLPPGKGIFYHPGTGVLPPGWPPDPRPQRGRPAGAPRRRLPPRSPQSGAGTAPEHRSPSAGSPRPVRLGRRGQTGDALHRPCAVRRREPRQPRAGRAPGEAARGAGPAGHGALPAPGWRSRRRTPGGSRRRTWRERARAAGTGGSRRPRPLKLGAKPAPRLIGPRLTERWPIVTRPSRLCRAICPILSGASPMGCGEGGDDERCWPIPRGPRPEAPCRVLSPSLPYFLRVTCLLCH